ncbi:predicted protein [Botrytis cinerea T4]|uniref:Uncharacterized protein n=1 Tax=Botryotinia fuckeliana (strain T4) TaxID=999810 RepID=G2Y0S7_BOTF4|nr:predicted protein [Botrytis cinerea T4]
MESQTKQFTQLRVDEAKATYIRPDAVSVEIQTTSFDQFSLQSSLVAVSSSSCSLTTLGQLSFEAFVTDPSSFMDDLSQIS